MRESTREAAPLVSKRTLGWAGAAAFVACAACCALPMLVAASAGGALTWLTAWFTPGAELYVALAAAGVTLAVLGWRAQRSRHCADSCAVDASCCAGASQTRSES